MKRPVLYYPSFEEGGLTLVTHYVKSLPSLYYFILGIAILTIIGVRHLDNSRIGRAWVAIREDETAAELSGVPTTWIKLLAYALGAAFASVAGAFFAAKLSYTNPIFSCSWSRASCCASWCWGGWAPFRASSWPGSCSSPCPRFSESWKPTGCWPSAAS
jgi:hypothetical protein